MFLMNLVQGLSLDNLIYPRQSMRGSAETNILMSS